MKKYQKDIAILTAREVLLSIFDLATPFFEASSIYRVSTRKYLRERDIEKSNFKNRIYYLKKMGLINSFVENKEGFLEITPKGLKKIEQINLLNPIINRPEIWDGKWRVVIFDIPDKHKGSRDSLRIRLLNIGFIKIQESVYVYPFECTNIVTQQSSMLLVEKYVLVMVSDIIQGEEAIIEKFLESGVLNKTDLVERRD